MPIADFSLLEERYKQKIIEDGVGLIIFEYRNKINIGAMVVSEGDVCIIYCDDEENEQVIIIKGRNKQQ